MAKSAAKNTSRQAEAISSDDEGEAKAKSVPARKVDKIFNRRNLDVLSPHYAKLRETNEAAADEENFFTVRRRDHELAGNDDVSIDAPEMQDKAAPPKATKKMTKKRQLLKLAASDPGAKTHVVFTEDGEQHNVLPYASEASFDRASTGRLAKEFIATEAAAMQHADKQDAERQRRVRHEAKMAKKAKIRKDVHA